MPIDNFMGIVEGKSTIAPPSSDANPEEEEGEYHSEKNSEDILSPNKKRIISKPKSGILVRRQRVQASYKLS